MINKLKEHFRAWACSVFLSLCLWLFEWINRSPKRVEAFIALENLKRQIKNREGRFA